MFSFPRNHTFNISNIELDEEANMLREKDDSVTGIALKPLLHPVPTSRLPHPLSLQLREAIKMRDLQAVIELLAASDLLASDWDENPLHMCIFYYCEATEGDTLTTIEMDIIKVILEKQPGILDHEDSSGSTALHRAILSGHLDVVRALLDSGATSNIGDITALHVAVKHPHILKFFLEKDVENIPNKTGCAPIHNAAVYDKVESIELLVDKFGEEQLMWKSDGATLLHVAARNGSIEVAKFLIKSPQYQHCYNINLKDKDGKTPTYLATEYGHKVVSALLLKNGAFLSDNVRKGEKKKKLMKEISRKFCDPEEFLKGVFDEFVYEETDCRGRTKICVDYSVLTENDGNGLGQMKVLKDLVYCFRGRLLLHPLPRSLLYLKMKLLLPVFYIVIAVYAIFLVSFNVYIFRFVKRGTSTAKCTDKTADICIECYAYTVVMALIFCTTCLMLAQDYIVIRAQGLRYFCNCEYYIPLLGYTTLLLLLAVEVFRPRCGSREYLEHELAFTALMFAWFRAWTLLVRLPSCGHAIYSLTKGFIYFFQFIGTAALFVFFLTFDIKLYYSLKSNSTSDEKQDPLNELLGGFLSVFEHIKASLGLTNKDVKNSDLDNMIALFCLILITFVIFMAMLWVNFSIIEISYGHGFETGDVGSLENQLYLLCSLDHIIRSALGKICKRLLMRRRHYCKIESYAPSDKTWTVSFNIDDNSTEPSTSIEKLNRPLRKAIIKKLKTKIDDDKESVAKLSEKINSLEIETKVIKDSIDYVKESVDNIKVVLKMLLVQKNEQKSPKLRKRFRSCH